MEEEEALTEMEEVTPAAAVDTVTERTEAETDQRTEEEKEEEEALAAPEFVGEMTEVTTTTAAVDTVTEGTEAETEEDGMEGEDKNGKEEEEGQVKKLPGLWESEVRTFGSPQSKIEYSERRRVRNQVINLSSFR